MPWASFRTILANPAKVKARTFPERPTSVLKETVFVYAPAFPPLVLIGGKKPSCTREVFSPVDWAYPDVTNALTRTRADNAICTICFMSVSLLEFGDLCAGCVCM